MPDTNIDRVERKSKQILIRLDSRLDSEIPTLLSAADRTVKQHISITNVSNVINQPDLINVYSILYPVTAEYTFSPKTK